MKTKTIFLVALLLSAGSPAMMAQSKNPNAETHSNNDSAFMSLLKPQKSITQGSVTVEGNLIHYKAVAGTLILNNSDNKPTCSMFYVAYFKDGVDDESQRPVTFMFDGGPGGSQMLLHINAWGPQILYIPDTQQVFLPPYKTINNDYNLLDATDIVFIDAPGTGFSRIINQDKGGAGNPNIFYSIDGDGQAFAQFITVFLTTYNRWNSPKYLFGASYGTFRSAVVSNILETERGVRLNGVIQTSQLLSFANSADESVENPGNDLPYELVLPTYAAIAWYHHRLPHQPEKLETFLKEVDHFALNEYAVALLQGASLDSSTSNQIAEKLHQYTGLPVNYIHKVNLRITGYDFEKALLGEKNILTSRYDARSTGLDIDPLNEYPLYDPMDDRIGNPDVSVFNNYLRTTLNVHYPFPYIPTSIVANSTWDFRHRAVYQSWGHTHDNFFPNVMPDLANAMIHNSELKVMLNMGYFDLATPFFEDVYEMKHLPIPKSLQKNISYHYYYAGHGVFWYPSAHKKLHDNVAKFIESTH